MRNNQINYCSSDQDYSDDAFNEQEQYETIRNTFWLLALSFIPTLIGVLIGRALQLYSSNEPSLTPLIITAILFIGSIIGARRSDDTAIALIFFLIYTLLSGLILSLGIDLFLNKYAFGFEILLFAALGTTLLFFVYALLATVSKEWAFYSPKHAIPFIFISLVSCAIVYFVVGNNIWVYILSIVGISAWTGSLYYGLHAVMSGEEDNPVRGAIDAHLSIFLIFESLFTLLSFVADRK